MYKIIFLTIIFSVIILFVKNFNQEIALILTAVCGIILLFSVLPFIKEIFVFFDDVIEKTGVNKSFFGIILKITAIGYVVEFGSETVRDFGLNSLSVKLEFLGKVLILTISLPIFNAVFNLLLKLV